MNLSLLLLLVALNAVFALSEIAIVSSRSARLQRLVDEGHTGARLALALHQEPSRFLSTIQVGITGVGVLSGALGEAVIADPVADWMRGYPALAPHARTLALAVAVLLITYLSVVLGELVPKRLGLRAPERIATLVAGPMRALERLATPLVWLLARSSDLVLGLFPGRSRVEPPVTDAEIATLMEQGAEAGVFHASEQLLVENVLRLDERRVTGIMTPRRDFVALEAADPLPVLHAALANGDGVAWFIVRDDDDILGVVASAALLREFAAGREWSLHALLEQPLRVPETLTTSRLLQVFREEQRQFALVTDEYGEVVGVVTDHDLLEAIVGDGGPAGSSGIQARGNDSWLVDGALDVQRLADELEVDLRDASASADYATVAGFVLDRLGYIPAETEAFEWRGLRFEVVDMDGRRIDKLLISRVAQAGGTPTGAD